MLFDSEFLDGTGVIARTAYDGALVVPFNVLRALAAVILHICKGTDTYTESGFTVAFRASYAG